MLCHMCSRIGQIACISQCDELVTVACHVCKIMKYLLADYTDMPAKSRKLCRHLSEDVFRVAAFVTHEQGLIVSLRVYVVLHFP